MIAYFDQSIGLCSFVIFLGIYEVSIGFLSHGATPNHPVVMDDHDLVWKPLVT